MTTSPVAVPTPPLGAFPRVFPRATLGVRLTRLHLVSRQVPRAVAVLAGCALLLRAALLLHWAPGAGPLAQQFPLAVESTAAMVIAVSLGSPFGESERTAGRRLPLLRLGAALGLSALALGALSLGAASAHLPGGEPELARDLAGSIGIGLLTACAFGGSVAWAGPLAYLAVAEFALTGTWHSPWMWADRPPHDLGAALCAGLMLVAGTAAVTVLGTRDRERE